MCVLLVVCGVRTLCLIIQVAILSLFFDGATFWNRLVSEFLCRGQPLGDTYDVHW